MRTPEVLFACVANAGRSQMAAALLAARADGRVTVRSAGTNPAKTLDRWIPEVLAEVGIDVSQEVPKLLTDDAVRAADVVVTMGCGEACPIYPGKRYEDWPIEDPAGKSIEDVRRIRDDIDRRVQALLAGLETSP